MKTPTQRNRFSKIFIIIAARVFFVTICLFCAGRGLSQTAPVLTIAPLGTNQFSITITNGVSGGNYELGWTPFLADPDYPWTTIAVGASGQTNFTLNMGVYQTGFFQALLDTNSVPLWEAADPNNPGAGILAVFIDSPTNGMVLQ
jgi:hypothetical protein